MENFRDFIYYKCVDFSIRIAKLYNYLCNDKHEYVFSKQILRSGTSIGANLAEAQYGISRKISCQKHTSRLRKQLKQCIGWKYCTVPIILMIISFNHYLQIVKN